MPESAALKHTKRHVRSQAWSLFALQLQQSRNPCFLEQLGLVLVEARFLHVTSVDSTADLPSLLLGSLLAYD